MPYNAHDVLLTLRARLRQLAERHAANEILGTPDPNLPALAAELRGHVQQLPLAEYVSPEAIWAFLRGGAVPAGLPTIEADANPVPTAEQQAQLDALGDLLNASQPTFREVCPKKSPVPVIGEAEDQPLAVGGLPSVGTVGAVGAPGG